MTRSPFEAFVLALAAELGHPLDPSSGVVPIQLNGVDFTLMHAPDRCGDGNVLFHCEFGALPQDRRAEILERALEMNADLHGLWSPVFAIAPGTGCLVAMSALPMDGLDGVSTVETLMRYVLIVERWKRTRFLDDESSTGSATASAPAPS